MVLFAALVALAGPSTHAQTALSGEQIHISRAAGPIVIDGDLSDPGWRGASRVDTWYETDPGDNLPAKIRSAAYLAFDDRFFYAGFEFDDPNPSAIRAALSDRDSLPGDWGGLMLDTRNDGHSAIVLMATPRGVQYDALSDDASGENSSVDFFWDSAARITDHGWTLEIRVPFSTLRYKNADPQTWGILLRRNYPREFNYQFSSAKLPRGGNCFVCRANTLVGLEHLPAGGHIVAAPYVSAAQDARPRDLLGSPLVRDPAELHGGLDVKWTPNADNAVDATFKPDFSQIESDTAQITANQRFALFFPERRVFFLEGVSLLNTPINAAYTRTITAPQWGGRVTGKEAGVAYTVLVADDRGGGSAILPGPYGSSTAPLDFGAKVLIARAKRDIGRSFVSMLVTDREADSNGHNRVFGPDFQWRPNGSDTVTGQFLLSATQTPNRPDLTPEWTGQDMTSPAGTLQWGHSTTRLDFFASYQGYGGGFRADTGFIPQVGQREVSGNGGWTFRPEGFVSRVHPFVYVDRQVDQSGALIFRSMASGLETNSGWGGYTNVQFHNEDVRTGNQLIGQRFITYYTQFSPSRAVSRVSVDGSMGQGIDFANSRPGHGGSVNLSATLHPTDHVELDLLQNREWLNVGDASGGEARLFTARISRVKGTYTFTARSFMRVIAQYTSTDQDPTLYLSPVSDHTGAFNGSVLVAYKLNWQSVLFVGYGIDRELSDPNGLQPAGRQIFAKVSYAFQR